MIKIAFKIKSGKGIINPYFAKKKYVVTTDTYLSKLPMKEFASKKKAISYAKATKQEVFEVEKLPKK